MWPSGHPAAFQGGPGLTVPPEGRHGCVGQRCRFGTSVPCKPRLPKPRGRPPASHGSGRVRGLQCHHAGAPLPQRSSMPAVLQGDMGRARGLTVYSGGAHGSLLSASPQPRTSFVFRVGASSPGAQFWKGCDCSCRLSGSSSNPGGPSAGPPRACPSLPRPLHLSARFCSFPSLSCGLSLEAPRQHPGQAPLCCPVHPD